MARKKIDYKNRSIPVTFVDNGYGQERFELRWDRYDEVLYLVDLEGNTKRIWPPLTTGLGYIQQVQDQRNNYVPSPLINDNSLTITFTSLTEIVCTLASPIFTADLTLAQISIDGGAVIDSYVAAGESTNTVTLTVSNTSISTEYKVTLTDIVNTIGDINTVSASATSPTPETYSTIISNSAGINDSLEFPSGAGLTYLDDGFFQIDLAQWDGGNQLVGVPQASLYVRNRIDICNNSEVVDVTGFSQSITFSINFTVDGSPYTITQADVVSADQFGTAGFDFVFDIPENSDFSTSTIDFGDGWFAIEPNQFLTLDLYETGGYTSLGSRLYRNNQLLSLAPDVALCP